MYKVVIADDEPLIIKGLRKLIDWKAVNATIVGEASDGAELLTMIETLRPDIVVSDIAMPKVSGIDVIRHVHEHYKDTRVIFLSGHQEFAYAQAAIKCGAIDYLIKPVRGEELEGAILKAKKSILRASSIDAWEEEETQELESKDELEVLRNRLRELEIDLRDKVLVGVCYKVAFESIEEIQDNNKLKLLRFGLFRQIQDYLKANKLGTVIKRDGVSSKLILVLPKNNDKRSLLDILKQMNSIAQETYHVKIAVGVGKAVTEEKDIIYAYKTAKFALGMYFFEPKNLILYDQIASREFSHSFEDYRVLYQELLQMILNKEESWTIKFMQCLDMIESIHYGNRYAVENRCVVLAMDLFRDLNEYFLVGEEEQAGYENWVDNLRNLTTFGELKEVFFNYCHEFICDIYKKQGQADKSMIYQIKSYIKANYAEDLSLEKIAKHFYLNQYYFSTFFKKETGQNYKNYLMEVRLKKAMKILMTAEDMKTYELAQAVGYKDVRTFTEKFKELYGDSPAGYKKKAIKN